MSCPVLSSKLLQTGPEKVAKVLAWANDRELFKREALFIRVKKGGLVPYQERPIQTQTNNTIRRTRRVVVLKARQLGITTGALGDLFHDFLFTPYTKIAFVAHHGSTAIEIFEIVATFYQLLPRWFRKLKLFSTVKDSAHALSLKNGSSFKVGTANSEFWRGQTFQHIHCSEAAFYDNLQSVFASIGMAVGDTGTITFETTAKGHNQFYKLWSDPRSGYTKLFYSWLLDPEYVHDYLPDDLTEVEQEYITDWELPFQRAAWFVKTFREKCGSNMNTFNAEMPIAPEVAFIATGARYFHKVFAANKPDKEGLNVYLPPIAGGKYVIGIDPASGSPTGDKSAIAVLEVSDPNRPNIAATYNAVTSIPDLAQLVQLLQKKYNHALVNPELNNHGLALITELRRLKVTRLFRDSKYNGKVTHWANEIGTLVTHSSRNLLLSSLREAIATGRLKPICPVLQYQCDHFVFNANGKPEHEVGENDDLIFAVAHAYYAAPYAKSVTATPEPTPMVHTHIEKLEWEMNNGRIYDGEMFDPTAVLDW